MRRVLILVPLVLGLVLAGGLFLPTSWFYRNGRRTRLGRATHRFMSWLSSLGLPPSWLVALEVRGRRSGRVTSTALVVGEHEHQRYLVSMLGERSEWVRNVRAAGGDAVIRHGRREAVRLEEVPIEQRAPIIKSYLRRAPVLRAYLKKTSISTHRHLGLDHNAPIQEFERIGADYPVFRIVGVDG